MLLGAMLQAWLAQPPGPPQPQAGPSGPKLLLGGSGDEGTAQGGPQVLLRGHFSPFLTTQAALGVSQPPLLHTITPRRPDPCDESKEGAEKAQGASPGWPSPLPCLTCFWSPPPEIPWWDGSSPQDPTGGGQLPFQQPPHPASWPC